MLGFMVGRSKRQLMLLPSLGPWDQKQVSVIPEGSWGCCCLDGSLISRTQGHLQRGTAHRAQGCLPQGIGTHRCSSKSTGKRSRGWYKGARGSRTTLVRVYCEFLKHCVPWHWDCCGNGGKSPSVGAEVVGAKVEVSRTQLPPAAASQSLPRLCVCGAEGKCWGLLPA